MPLRCTLWCSSELALIDELHSTHGMRKLSQTQARLAPIFAVYGFSLPLRLGATKTQPGRKSGDGHISKTLQLLENQVNLAALSCVAAAGCCASKSLDRPRLRSET